MVWQLIKGFLVWGGVAIVVQVLTVGLSYVSGASRFFLLKLLYACIYTLVFLAAGESGADISSPLQMAPPAICLVLHMALNGYIPEAPGSSTSSSTKSSRGYPGL